jgi:transcriptional regulator with XRE-family HTH domain
MEELSKHPDVARIFTRLLESVGLNAAQFARKIGSTPQAISNYMVGRNEPGRKMLAQIIEAFPRIDAAWLATGEGEPFPEGRHLSLANVAEEPTARYAPAAPVADPALAVQLVAELADCQKQNRLDLARAQREFREDLVASSKTWQYTVDRMADTIAEQREQIRTLQDEIHDLRLRAGLRFPTAAEAELIELQARNARAGSAPIGFGKSQPQGAEMHATPGGLHEQSFPWLPAAETEPSPLSIAA